MGVLRLITKKLKSIDMNKFDLQKRTMQFHVDVIKLCGRFPKNAAGFETAKQLIRSAGSVGANYRAACRAKSNADWIFKIEVVLEEADESLYWMQASKAASLVEGEDLEALIRESNELVSIFNAADITSKKNRDTSKGKNAKINKPQNQDNKRKG
jgi:four helix bundle protein